MNRFAWDCYFIFVAFFFKLDEMLFSYSDFYAKESNFSPLWKIELRFWRTPWAISSSSISILFNFLSDSASFCFYSSSSVIWCFGLTLAMASYSFIVRLCVRLPMSSLSSWTSYSIYFANSSNFYLISSSDDPSF